MGDALTPVEIYPFHTIRKIGNRQHHLYIGDVWRPDRHIFIIGATMGLLCLTTNRAELYLSISRNDCLKPTNYFRALKRDFLFYLQRDQRREPGSPDDLTRDIFLPAGSGFQVLKDEPIYFKCGAMNKSGRTSVYDILATLYWVEMMSTELPELTPHIEKSHEL
ncbi:hypothetical protein ES703_41458 [subsurface metagenome]